MQTVCILPYIWKMMKHSISGIKRLESRQRESSVLERKITSGSMEQDLADHVQKYIMTVGKNTDVDSLDVPSDVNVTVIWRSGTTYLHSLTMTDITTIQN